MMRKGAKASSGGGETRKCHRQGARNECPGRTRDHYPINYLPKGSPHWRLQNGKELRKLRKGPKVGSKQARIKPGCLELPP